MSNYTNDKLEIILEQGEVNKLIWKGKSEERDPAAKLNPYFETIFDSLKDKKLLVEFSDLQYMNSSTVPPIIKLFKKLDDLGINTEVSYDKDSPWQSASFKALETIAFRMEHITVL